MLDPRIRRACAVAALIIAPLVGSLGAQQIADPSPSAVQAAPSHIQIDNFGEIGAGYYRGAQPEGHDYSDLAAMGVKTIIDLTKDGDVEEPAAALAAGLQFHRIPMTTHEPPTSADITEFLTLVTDPANQPVYVHCQGGRHRTGVMTAVYRMTQDGWSADRAFSEMKKYKFGADFLHPEFKQFVYAFHAPALVTKTAAR
jgi:protein tyrosine/serine phosphatase